MNITLIGTGNAGPSPGYLLALLAGGAEVMKAFHTLFAQVFSSGGRASVDRLIAGAR